MHTPKITRTQPAYNSNLNWKWLQSLETEQLRYKWPGSEKKKPASFFMSLAITQSSAQIVHLYQYIVVATIKPDILIEFWNLDECTFRKKWSLSGSFDFDFFTFMSYFCFIFSEPGQTLYIEARPF